jgi:hypothetical protein
MKRIVFLPVLTSIAQVCGSTKCRDFRPCAEVVHRGAPRKYGSSLRILVHVVGLIACLCSFWAVAQAQIPDQTPTDTLQGEQPGAGELSYHPDTLRLWQYPALRPWQLTEKEAPDIHHIRHYDPTMTPGRLRYGRLHNIGAAAVPLQPMAPRPVGFEVGREAWVPYLLAADSLHFIETRAAYTDVAYIQGPTSEDGIFKGTFARRFGRGTDFYIEALRIYHLGEYTRLTNKHSSLRTGLQYQSPNARYRLALLHGNHLIDTEENGGIRTDTLYGQPLYLNRANVPVALQRGQNIHREIDYQLAQFLALAGQVDKDSLGRLLLLHRVRWQERRFKYSDTSPPMDLDFYGPFLTDARGVRQFTSWNTLSNLAEVLFSWRSRGGHGVSLQGGLDHRLHRWNNEVLQRNLQNLLLVSELGLDWKSLLRAEGKLQLDLGDQIGSFLFEGAVQLQLYKWGMLRTGLVLNRRFADLMQQTLAVSRRLVYDFSFDPVQHQMLYSDLAIPALKLRAGVQFHLINRAVYFEAPGLPQQLDGTAAQSRIWVQHEFKLWKIHLDQEISWQTTSDNRLPLPGLLSRHDLYYEGNLFRGTLRTRLGAEVHLISPWTPMGYMPVHSAFYVQDAWQEGWYPQIDAYVSIERQGFRLFFEFENMAQSIFGTQQQASNGIDIPRVYATVAGYPQPANWIRFGAAFTWRY